MSMAAWPASRAADGEPSSRVQSGGLLTRGWADPAGPGSRCAYHGEMSVIKILKILGVLVGLVVAPCRRASGDEWVTFGDVRRTCPRGLAARGESALCGSRVAVRPVSFARFEEMPSILEHEWGRNWAC